MQPSLELVTSAPVFVDYLTKSISGGVDTHEQHTTVSSTFLDQQPSAVLFSSGLEFMWPFFVSLGILMIIFFVLESKAVLNSCETLGMERVRFPLGKLWIRKKRVLRMLIFVTFLFLITLLVVAFIYVS